MMNLFELSTMLSSRVLRTEIVGEGEIGFLFVDGQFQRILGPGRHRLRSPSRARVERVPLAEPRVIFAEIEAIKDRDDVRRVTSSIHVDEGTLGLGFRRGVFFGFLAPGLHVYARPPATPDPLTFEILTPTLGGELVHPAADAIVRHPEAPRYLKSVQVESGLLGLLYVDGVFTRRLGPGRHLLFETAHALRVDTARGFEPIGTGAPELLLGHPELEDKLLYVTVKDSERGLVFAGQNFRRFLGPGQYLFLKTATPPLRVETVDIDEPEVTHPDRGAILRSPDAGAQIASFPVAQGQVGLLFVDGILRRRVEAGVHAYWTGLHQIRVQVVDLREIGTEVQGQELLTADKVSLRLNVSVRYRITDVDRAVLEHADYEGALHRCLQLALREEVQRLTLDELLSRKEDVSAAILARAKDGAAELGVEIRSAGLRDVILPGEMRTILNQVVEAERRAQANLITRREETAATRSLLNTARLLDENPTLMRLKKLEHAERIAEKIAHLSVVGGIDQLVPTIRQALTPKT